MLTGAWDGGGTRDFEADFHRRRNGAAVSSTDDPANQPVPIGLERDDAATQSARRCAALAHGS